MKWKVGLYRGVGLTQTNTAPREGPIENSGLHRVPDKVHVSLGRVGQPRRIVLHSNADIADKTHQKNDLVDPPDALRRVGV